MFVVVLGHLLLAVIDRHDGAVRGANLLALHPGWQFLGVFAPMPVFFAAAGWANATSSFAAATARVRTLVGLGAVVVCNWSAGAIVAELITGDSGALGDGARIATQPLWFIAAYVPLAAAGRRLASAAARNVVGLVCTSLVTLAALDAAEFGFGAPEWVRWPGFYLVWATPWVLGCAWRSNYENDEGANLDERRVGLALVATAGIGCVALVAFGGYDPSLIDAVPGTRSNTTPPTLYTAVAAIAQVGILLLCANTLDRAGRRWRRFWDRAGELAVGIYAWHLSALALCAGVIAVGMPSPERLTVSWWLTRPLWFGAVIGVTFGFVVLTGAVRSRLARWRPRPLPPSSQQATFGVIVAAAGAALVGLRGPRSIELAIVCSAAFVAGWLLLRSGVGVDEPG